MAVVRPTKLFRRISVLVALSCLALLTVATLGGYNWKRLLAADITADSTPVTAVVGLDDKKKMDDAGWRQTLRARFPDIPVDMLMDNQKRRTMLRLNTSCGFMPKIWDLKISNDLWQEMGTSNGTFYFYRAYYDDRKLEKLGPSVRVLAMHDNMTPAQPIYCHFWYEKQSRPVVTKSKDYKLIWVRLWGGWRPDQLQPYLITCPLPPSGQKVGAPSAVAFTAKPCDKVRAMVRVRDARPEKGHGGGRIAICVKGMSFPADDLSVRMAEWLEVLRAVGVDRVFLYELGIHPNVSKLLSHYQKDGFVDLTPLRLPGPQANEPHYQHLYLKDKVTPKRQNEVIPYNDCLYRNLNLYEYVGLLDIDELMIPIRFDSLGELVDYAAEVDGFVNWPRRSSVCFRNVYFMDDMLAAQHDGRHFEDIPPWMHVMQHVYRSSEYSKPGFYPKCLHRTDRVRTLHNHYPFSCLTACSAVTVDRIFGHLQHYRRECVKELAKVCAERYKNTSVVDKAVWRFKDTVIARTTSVLTELGFLAAV